MKVMLTVLVCLILSAAYMVYSLYLSLIGQPLHPQWTGLAIGALFTSSYFLVTKQLPGWNEGDHE
ncbi:MULTISPECIES: hypothetical protein [unclassified Exiguobacterium]|uniref:hypothetical protein n=1 Tax=unclassified Exiguobacterium TaxID=2644629 RepID=UPI001039F469|nr:MULTISPECIES: hypothetical protein [unclassified Exiguobacterium]TCI45922.1 hypothetical protein EVJ31_07110 [Exiguobacterium sp. SH5S32]TCI51679.1 hypothetical protein EVJ25_09360 [Exiguobacterium sp. SH1S4]TCI53721.1 hypothetical protein EVJ24_08510 [Exiguobacterium sp. SH1S21]TCI71665.1 hypothetical protein EVJ23_07105 [Exiguobacterium sp. SH1S1]